MTMVRDAALTYLAQGVSVVPIRSRTKVAALRWEAYQDVLASPQTVGRWFDGPGREVAAIMGPVSGGLACRDFDVRAAYDAWSKAHADLAGTLPTVKTHRGYGVYFRAPAAAVNVQKYADGELRLARCYCLWPPSQHQQGTTYSWTRELRNLAELPLIVDFSAAGFLGAPLGNRDTEPTEDYRAYGCQLRETEAIKGQPPPSGELNRVGELLRNEAVQRAILETLPKDTGTRNTLTWSLARALKGIAGLTDARLKDLVPIVREWHRMALPVIETKDFDTTLADFNRSWSRVKFPRGVNPMSVIFEQAKRSPMPKAAQQFDSAECRLLVMLCRELQRQNEPGPFYLSCRTAGEQLNIHYKQAWKFLSMLVSLDVLVVAEKPARGAMRAIRYRYVAGD